MLAQFFPVPAASRRASIILAALIAAAWVLLFAWQHSPYAALMGHEALDHHHMPFAVPLGLFLLSWLLMTVAMMLPVSLPAIVASQADMPRGGLPVTAVVAAYLMPWALFGLLAYLGDSALHEITGHGGPAETAARFIAPSIILAAGVYQLTPLKHGFLSRCRSFENPVPPGDDGRTASAFARGLRVGLSCFGSCWLLMLLMFALGHHRLEWMLLFGAAAAAERLTPWGHRLSWIVGIALILWAAGSLVTVMG